MSNNDEMKNEQYRKAKMHKDLTTSQVFKVDDFKPDVINSKVISYDDHDVHVSLCKTYILYDVVVMCVNTNCLKKFKKANNLESTLINDSIYKMPLLVYDTFEELKDAKEVYNNIEGMIK